MKKLIVLAMCLFVVGCSGKHFEPLNKREIQLQSAYTLLAVVDWRQTQQIVDNPDKFEELNPLYGSHPSSGKVAAIMAAGLAVDTGITWFLPHKWRGAWQIASIGVRGAIVGNNFKIGLNGDF